MTGFIRKFFATHLPPAFARLQKGGILPSLWGPGNQVRLGGGGSGYMERLEEPYSPAQALNQYVIAGDDQASKAYRKLFANFDERTAPPLKYGVITASNVKVWPAFGVHASPAGSFADVYCNLEALTNPKYEIPRLALRFKSPKVRYGNGVFLGIAWWHNHYHWFGDILPRLDLVRSELAGGLPLVLPPSLRAVQRDALMLALDSLGIGEIRLINPPRDVCAFEHLTMPTQMARSLDISPRQVRFLRQAFIREDSYGNGPKRIYVSRSDAKIRRIVNEDALMAALAPLGFVKVTLAELTFAQQVELFQQADCVIGHHGAGHTNVVFCSPGALLVEIFQEGHFSPRFARMSQIVGMRYGYIVGTREGADTSVSVPTLCRLLDQIGLT